MLGGEDHRGIARVYAGILYMLGNGIFHYFALIGHGIKLNLLCLLHKLAHNDGELFRHLCGHVQETVELLIVVAHVHGCAAEHVGRTHQYGIAHVVDKLFHVFERG